MAGRRKKLYRIIRYDYRDIDNTACEVIGTVTKKNIDSTIKEDVEQIKKLPEVHAVDYVNGECRRAVAYSYDIDTWWTEIFEWSALRC